ncbi:MAG TPA: tRNA lysidine(34) synthetase TilS [Candidatus Binatia bacterium]|nr:tRNA lysidine(34) synthetase TilS [Candidatus Binatia bacterium]
MRIKENVRAAIQRHELISRGDRVVVAVSGGPDSVALLHLLLELREEFELHVEVAHLQHGMRGAEADGDAEFVGELARKLDLTFHLKTIDVPRIKVSAGKGNLEALARAERYRFFAQLIRDRSLDKVATAHTQDDQAETVLMWFLRGSGMKGIGGMAPVQYMNLPGDGAPIGVTVVRPLLEVAKAEILEYLNRKSQPYRLDRTNQDTALLRNWVRLELLPSIRQRLDGRLNERLGRQARLIREEDQLLDGLARQKLEGICANGGLHRDGLLAEPAAMQRRLLRLWIEKARGNLSGLGFVHVDDLLRLIKEGPPQGRLALPGALELAREYGTLKLVRRTSRIKRTCYSYEFNAGSSLRIPQAGSEIHSEVIKAPLVRYPADFKEAVFDSARLTGPLAVRNFRRGDYFQPLGMNGHKKIKDLFIENKLTLSARANWPLLVLGREVLWIPGYGRSDLAKVTRQTERILKLNLVSLGT